MYPIGLTNFRQIGFLNKIAMSNCGGTVNLISSGNDSLADHDQHYRHYHLSSLQYGPSCVPVQERYQQLMRSRRYKSVISQSGAWCPATTETSHMTDQQLAAALVELFAGGSVASLGEGLGKYRALVLQAGKVARFDAFDGTPGVGKLTRGQVRYN